MKKSLSDSRIIIITILITVILSIVSYVLLCCQFYDKIYKVLDGDKTEGVGYTIHDDSFVITWLLGDVIIGSDVKNIKNEIDPNCNNADSITINEKNKYYYSHNNCVFEKETGKLIIGCKNSILSPEVNEIDEKAFLSIDKFKNSKLRFNGNIEDWLKNSQYSVRASIHFTEVLFLREDTGDYQAVEKIDLNYDIDTIYDYAFANFKELREINFGENVKTIKDYAFLNCLSLRSIYIPKTVTTIGIGILKGCKNINTITIPYVLNYDGGIGPWLYEGTKFSNPSENLKKVVVLNGEILPKDSFAYLTEVKTIEIYGDNILIDKYAFRNCSSLKILKIYAKISNINEFAFVGVKLDELHYVESEMKFKEFFQLDEYGQLKSYPSPNNFYVISN